MNDEVVLSFFRRLAAGAQYISCLYSAILCSTAGLLEGNRATRNWTALEVLPLFDAIPTNTRVVIAGNMIAAGGLTSGIGGSLVVASLLRGENCRTRVTSLYSIGFRTTV